MRVRISRDETHGRVYRGLLVNGQRLVSISIYRRPFMVFVSIGAWHCRMTKPYAIWEWLDRKLRA